MIQSATILPPERVMFRALLSKDPSYDGVFFTAVRTTGIFCRPICTAKKPLRRNVEFFPTPREALLAGYRPCRRCNPVGPAGAGPDWVGNLLKAVEKKGGEKICDSDLRSMGLDPTRVRRWFKRNLGMTFHGYQRAFRLGEAMGRLKQGDKLTQVAYDHGFESLSGFRDAFQKFFGVTPANGTPARVVTVTRIPTPLGPMIAGASDRGICLLEFVDRRMIETQIHRLQKRMKCSFVPGNHPHIDRLATELGRYFDGTLRRFSVPLDTPGSPFQQRVWRQLRAIPYGSTRSYQVQAKMAGMAAAVRAVARANGDNRIAIVIPCHRVIGSDGALCGYGGGLWRKKRLLELEQRLSRPE